MTLGTVETYIITDIANAVRAQNGTDTRYKPLQLPNAIRALNGIKAGEGAQLPAIETESGEMSSGVFEEIADAIREQNGLDVTYRPDEMAAEILALRWKIHALLLEDGTMEIVFANKAQSPSGGAIAYSYEVELDTEFTKAKDQPWYDQYQDIKHVVIDPSVRNCGLKSVAYWFYSVSSLIDITGFENLEGVESADRMLYYCDHLETIYAEAGFEPCFTGRAGLFWYCYRLIGGEGYHPTEDDDATAFKHGAGGVFTDPADDHHHPINFYVQSDGKLIVTPEVLDGTYQASWRWFALGEYADMENQVRNDHDLVTSIEIRKAMRDVGYLNMNYWFYGMSKATELTGLRYLKAVHQMVYTFGMMGAQIKELDMTGFDPSSLTNLDYTFSNSGLTTIYVDPDWTLPVTAKGALTFAASPSLVGGNNTTWNTAHIDSDYMRVDKDGAPGYLTAKTNEPDVKPRALLLEDGTLEFTNLGSAESPSGGEVLQAFDVAAEGYTSATTIPWKDVRDEFDRVVIDASFKGAGVTSGAYWFSGCSGLVEVRGFENLSSMTSASQMFLSCSHLESIYAAAGFVSKLTSGSSMFYGCNRLVGGTDGFVPSTSANHSVCKLGAGGVLTNPTSDARRWCWGHFYEDGTLELTATATPDVGRVAVGSGRLCVNAVYNAVGIIPCYEHRTQFERVVIKPDMNNYTDVNTNYWFFGLATVTSIEGLGNLHGVHEMEYTFASCSGLNELDFTGFDPSGLTSLFYTFSGCGNLTTIYADADWELPKSGLTGMQCFYNCKALQGGAGTKFDTSRTAYTYMVIDSSDTQGYLTVKQ